MRVHGLGCLVTAGWLLGCAQPPTLEVDMAAARVDAARGEGAADHAREALLEAEQSLTLARMLLDDPAGYRQALRAAATACLRADEARRQAIEEKNKAARRADRCLREVRSLLDEARSLGARRSDPHACEGYLSRADAIQSTLDAGHVGEASVAAEALKQELLAWLDRLARGQDSSSTSK
jgi:hypothetical protein